MALLLLPIAGNYLNYEQLSITKEEGQIILPEIYKDFYDVCSGTIPANLVGTDLFNQHKELQESVFELLEENSVDNFLDDKDFIFMMHQQGYIFWYFKADGNLGPDMIIYSEVNSKVEI